MFISCDNPGFPEILLKKLEAKKFEECLQNLKNPC